MKVGTPNIKLDRINNFGNKQKHTGNAKAVACEALSERYSNDPDLDRGKTKDNIYLGKFQSGTELAEYWESLADDHRSVTKDGKEKKLRSDAGIGFAGIIKPNSDEFSKMSQEEKLKFMQDSYEIIKGMYEEKGGIMEDYVKIFLNNNLAEIAQISQI